AGSRATRTPSARPSASTSRPERSRTPPTGSPPRSSPSPSSPSGRDDARSPRPPGADRPRSRRHVRLLPPGPRHGAGEVRGGPARAAIRIAEDQPAPGRAGARAEGGAADARLGRPLLPDGRAAPGLGPPPRGGAGAPPRGAGEIGRASCRESGGWGGGRGADTGDDE